MSSEKDYTSVVLFGIPFIGDKEFKTSNKPSRGNIVYFCVFFSPAHFLSGV